MSVHVEVCHGNVLEHQADVLALKFAQDLYGVDQRVVSLLASRGIRLESRLPALGESLLVRSEGVVAANDVLFIGVEPLGRFEYGTIREFSHRVLSVLAEHRPEVSHVAMTLHGRGFGLDESEALRAEVAGILDAVHARKIPPVLRTISIVESDANAAERMRALLATIIPLGVSLEPSSVESSQSRLLGIARSALETVGHDSQAKPLVFVAMPFADEYSDRFHYGIKGAANAAGFLCERADLASFTGDVIAWVKQRIDDASLVVADLTSANPNVYLEVGYAWGRGVNTVLLVEHGDELKFDVRTQRCLVFRNIRHLEELLTTELTSLKVAQGAHLGQRRSL
jgi:hypothetical protein